MSHLPTELAHAIGGTSHELDAAQSPTDPVSGTLPVAERMQPVQTVQTPQIAAASHATLLTPATGCSSDVVDLTLS